MSHATHQVAGNATVTGVSGDNRVRQKSPRSERHCCPGQRRKTHGGDSGKPFKPYATHGPRLSRDARHHDLIVRTETQTSETDHWAHKVEVQRTALN
jgi:hypothetical protein